MDVLETLRGGLIVSCQPVDAGPMDQPTIVAAMAMAAVAGGAVGLRIEGVDNLKAVRPKVDVPVIGIVKSDLATTPVRITVEAAHAVALSEAGADIIAYDATPRSRPDSRDRVLATILDCGRIAMADCSSFEDGHAALKGGAGILGTTLSGYTAETEGLNEGPDFALIEQFATLDAFVMAEGRFNTPDLVARARSAGADAVTVGSALTRLEHVTSWFVDAMRRAS